MYLSGAEAVVDPGTPPDEIAEGASLWAWVEAGVDAATAALNNDDPVATWGDLSAGAHDMAQGTAENRPIYKVGVLNGLPTIRFDGVNDGLSNAVDPSGVNDGACVAVVAMAPSPTTARNTVFCYEGATSTHQFNARGSDADGNDVSISWNGTLRTSTTELPTDLSFHVVAWRHKAASGGTWIWLDGVEILDTTAAGAGQTRLTARIGKATASANPFKGDIAALAAYTGDVSEASLFEVGQYFAAIYGLPDWV